MYLEHFYICLSTQQETMWFLSNRTVCCKDHDKDSYLINAICIPQWTYLFIQNTRQHCCEFVIYIMLCFYQIDHIECSPHHAHATVSCRLSLYKLLFSFSHPSLPCFSIKLDYGYGCTPAL